MEANRQQRIDAVWAAAFMAGVAILGLAFLFTFGGGTSLDTIIAIDLVAGWTISVLTVVLLLTLPAREKILLALGRVLVWLALLTLLVAGLLGALSIAGVG